MSKPAINSVFETDFFKALDPSKFMADFKMPGWNMGPLFAIQRKNMEAMAALNQVAFENIQTIIHRQAEIMRQTCEQNAQMINSIISAPSPQDKVMLQAEASKAVVEKCMENAREVSETLSRYNTQAMQTVANRMQDSMQELREIVSSETRNVA